MPNAAPTLEPLTDGTGYRTRVRFGTKQQRRFRILTTDEVRATRTAVELIALGATIGKALNDLRCFVAVLPNRFVHRRRRGVEGEQGRRQQAHCRARSKARQAPVSSHAPHHRIGEA